MCCGRLQIMGHVQGPQTPYRARLLGFYLAASLAPPGSKIAFDNQAMAEHVMSAIYHEACDEDLCVPLAELPNAKNITVCGTGIECHGAFKQ